jgi:hypothetical protein
MSSAACSAARVAIFSAWRERRLDFAGDAAGRRARRAWPMALIPAMLRNRFGISEILSSLMLVYVAELLLDYLVRGPWRDPSAFNFPKSVNFDAAATLRRSSRAASCIGAWSSRCSRCWSRPSCCRAACSALPSAPRRGAARRQFRRLQRSRRLTLAGLRHLRRAGRAGRGHRGLGQHRPACSPRSGRATASPPSSSPFSAA